MVSNPMEVLSQLGAAALKYILLGRDPKASRQIIFSVQKVHSCFVIDHHISFLTPFSLPRLLQFYNHEGNIAFRKFLDPYKMEYRECQCGHTTYTKTIVNADGEDQEVQVTQKVHTQACKKGKNQMVNGLSKRLYEELGMCVAKFNQKAIAWNELDASDKVVRDKVRTHLAADDSPERKARRKLAYKGRNYGKMKKKGQIRKERSDSVSSVGDSSTFSSGVADLTVGSPIPQNDQRDAAVVTPEPLAVEQVTQRPYEAGPIAMPFPTDENTHYGFEDPSTGGRGVVNSLNIEAYQRSLALGYRVQGVFRSPALATEWLSGSTGGILPPAAGLPDLDEATNDTSKMFKPIDTPAEASAVTEENVLVENLEAFFNQVELSPAIECLDDIEPLKLGEIDGLEDDLFGSPDDWFEIGALLSEDDPSNELSLAGAS